MKEYQQKLTIGFIVVTIITFFGVLFGLELYPTFIFAVAGVAICETLYQLGIFKLPELEKAK